MSGPTSIEWTDATWNPVRGCSRVSPGCENCYAEKIAARFSDPGMWGHGYAERGPHGGRWTRRVSLLGQDALELPMRWREPRRVFVNSTSDLFHESLTNEDIARVFGVAAACPQHTFQVLTKRARRMREWFEWIAREGRRVPALVGEPMPPGTSGEASACVMLAGSPLLGARRFIETCQATPWPLPNVWIGVSAEDQRRADERIPELLRVPAAVHFVSYEPALGPIAFREEWLHGAFSHCPDETNDPRTDECAGCTGIPGNGDYCGAVRSPRLDWVIGGSESGPGARPCDPAWIQAAALQCERTRVAFFTKQIATPEGRANGCPKGGDPRWWPNGYWPRQFPEVRHAP